MHGLRNREVPPGVVGADLGDEAALVERARRSPQAFAPLYARYAAPIYGYCYHRLRSHQAAEDATSVIFTKALAALPSHRGSSFRAWLFGIAHHVVGDVRRARGQDESLDAVAAVVDASPSPEELALASEDKRSLHAALAQLPSAQRRILELRLAGLTSTEIGQVLNMRRGTVDVAQYRAVGRLRTLLRGTAGTQEEHRGRG